MNPAPQRHAPAIHAWLILTLMTLAFSTSGWARELAGVTLPENLNSTDGPMLKLNGAGIRKKFVVKIYVGALYLEQKLTTADAVIGSNDSKLVRMHFLYKLVSQEKLAESWKEGIESNHNKDQVSALNPRLKKFNACFPDAKKGDVIDIAFTRSGSTLVAVNSEPKCTIDGKDFQQAVLKVWLGDKPADANLKKGMLGGP